MFSQKSGEGGALHSFEFFIFSLCDQLVAVSAEALGTLASLGHGLDVRVLLVGLSFPLQNVFIANLIFEILQRALIVGAGETSDITATFYHCY